MKGIPLLLIAMVVAGGCIQTPAKVANEMPAVLTNVSNDVGNVTGPIADNLTNWDAFNQTKSEIDSQADGFNLSGLRGFLGWS